MKRAVSLWGKLFNYFTKLFQDICISQQIQNIQHTKLEIIE